MQLTLVHLVDEGGVLEVPRAVSGGGSEGEEKRRCEVDDLVNEERDVSSGEMPSLKDYQAGTDRVEKFMRDATSG